MIRKYQKKPIVVSAVLFDGDNFGELEQFTANRFRPWFGGHRTTADGKVATAEVFDYVHSEWISVRNGDYIIRGLRGENYPCDPAVFHHSYLEVI